MVSWASWWFLPTTFGTVTFSLCAGAGGGDAGAGWVATASAGGGGGAVTTRSTTVTVLAAGSGSSPPHPATTPIPHMQATTVLFTSALSPYYVSPIACEVPPVARPRQATD